MDFAHASQGLKWYMFLLTFLNLTSQSLDLTHAPKILPAQDRAQRPDVHAASASAFVLELVRSWKV